VDTQTKTMRAPRPDVQIRAALGRGLVIPACPLALNRARKLDERRQRALFRYYIEAGAGGLAVGVHTTQFAIRTPQNGLFRPLLELAAAEMDRADSRRAEPVVRIAGVCGLTPQALSEAEQVRATGYHAGLLNLGGLKSASEKELITHCRAVAEVIPLVGFYLQPAAGGRVLPFSFWRRLVEIDRVVAIKIAPFNRYQTLEVVRAVIEAGRDDLALYTGNDDNIVLDLLTPYRLQNCNGKAERRMTGGLLGQWAVWTRKAVELVDECHRLVERGGHIPADMLRLHVELTDANAVIFDAANNFVGCIAGIHEILRRQGLLEGTWCLDPNETLSPGQAEEIDRIYRAYPHLNDDDFVRENLDRWLSD
jgi:dihydrodipicolinate synthase/N-acetylneuraminate lyase